MPSASERSYFTPLQTATISIRRSSHLLIERMPRVPPTVDQGPSTRPFAIPAVPLAAGVAPARPLPLCRSKSTSHANSTSEWRAQRNRERDPAWVPRPPNAFIIYRAEYSRIHAAAHREREHTEEKTLSKRAAEAWRALSDEEKSKYKELAETERQEHASRHPNYRFKPRRRQGEPRKAAARGAGSGSSAGVGAEPAPRSMSRREQVESFMRRTASRASSVSESESASDYDYTNPPSPTSVGPSSPDSPGTPYRGGSPSQLGQPSSSSSSPQESALTDRFQRSMFLSPASSASTPALVSHQSTAFGGSLLVPSSVSSPVPGFNTYSQLDSTYIADSLRSRETADTQRWSPYSFQEPSALDLLAFDGPFVSVPGVPISHSAAGVSSLAGRADMSGSCPPPASPLYHRRRRAATTSGALPSPLAVVTSSLGDWGGAQLPTLTVSSPGRLLGPPGALSDPAALHTQPEPTMWPAQPSVAVPQTLQLPAMGMDLDRTPRSSDFPHNVQEYQTDPCDAESGAFAESEMAEFSAPAAAADPGADMFGVNTTDADFASYNRALAELGIEPVVYNMSPFEELDFSEFFNFDGDA